MLNTHGDGAHCMTTQDQSHAKQEPSAQQQPSDSRRTAQSPAPGFAYQLVRSSLVELFRLDPARITPDARLADDLGVDSIDAVDLVDRVKRTTGHKLSAQDFKSVRTVADLAEAVERLIRV
jgi:acyl carrier protein